MTCINMTLWLEMGGEIKKAETVSKTYTDTHRERNDVLMPFCSLCLPN